MRIIKLFSVIIILFASSCVSEKEDGVYISDAMLYNLATNTSSFTYYKNDNDTLPADPLSPHGHFIRVRFNPKAVSAMNQNVSQLTSSYFPDESMIVKEVYDSRGGSLIVYAIMYKLHGASNNGSGWVWNEMTASGDVFTSADHKGEECVSCHSSGDHSDLVRTFALH